MGGEDLPCSSGSLCRVPDVEEGSESVNLLPPSSGTAHALRLWHPFPASPSHFLPHLSAASRSSKNGKPLDLSRIFILTVWDSKQGRGEWQSYRSGPGKRGESALLPPFLLVLPWPPTQAATEGDPKAPPLPEKIRPSPVRRAAPTGKRL